MTWALFYTKQANKDAKKLSQSGLNRKAQELLKIIAGNPFQTPPPYEKLVSDLLGGAYPREINIQHKLIFQVAEEEDRTIKVLRMRSHYK